SVLEHAGDAAAADARTIGRADVGDDLDEIAGNERHPYDAAETLIDGAALQADPRPHDLAELAQVFQYRLHRVHEHREADRLRFLGDERIDADHGAAPIDARSARVAGVDAGIGPNPR